MTALRGTPEQQLIHLNMHWGKQYKFTAPNLAGAPWTAQAKFGDQDELTEETSSELLLAVRQHYEANRPR